MTIAVKDANGVNQNIEVPNANGQQLMAGSKPVVIASNQSPVAVTGTFFQATQPVSLTALPALATGANVIGGVTQSGTWNVGTLTSLSQFGGQAINLGAGNVGTGTLRVTLASDGALTTVAGATTDAAVANGASGTLAAYLRAIKDGVTSTTPSPIELGPFTVKNIAASQTNAVVGATGAVGDYLQHFIIQPATTSPGIVTIYDGSTGGTNATLYSFPGGASSVSNLAPIIIGLSTKAVNAGFHVTTGANVSVTLVGTYT